MSEARSGKVEVRVKPKSMSGESILQRVQAASVLVKELRISKKDALLLVGLVEVIRSEDGKIFVSSG